MWSHGGRSLPSCYLRSMNAFLKLELTLNPVQPASDVAIAWLSEVGFDMFENTETGVVVHAPWGQVEPSDWEAVIARLQQMPGVTAVAAEQERIEAANWNAAWEADYAPIDVDGLACMRAPFHAAPEGGLDLIIQPQMSFGTGHHATTWQMLRQLLNQPVAGQSVLDMGCGTGVLAIAAKKLGAQRVVAIDIDEWSYENTQSNAALNAITDMEILHGDATLLQQFPHAFDGICANINRNILVADWAAYDAALKPGGWALMSGFYPSDVAHLTTEAAAHGWALKGEWERDGWACVQWEKAGA